MSNIQSIGAKLEAFVKNTHIDLSGDNRWVALEDAIPWDELLKECAPEARDSFRALFAACLVEAQRDLSDGETIKQIQESPYLQYFCGMSGYNGKALPFGEKELRSFREKLGERELQRMKALIGAPRP